MDFGFSDEQLALQETARRFAQEEMKPIAAAHDQSAEMPMGVMRHAWELGLSCTTVPAEYGGVGLCALAGRT